MKSNVWIALALVGLLLVESIFTVIAGNDAPLTTINIHVDGAAGEACGNPNSSCNHFNAKEYVWLNGETLADRLGKDGAYFFAVLEPGGQGDPNDGGEKNLSDEYDVYTERTFEIANGEMSFYGGLHWLDSGRNESLDGDPKPNGILPYIRLFPFADTTNPGGVYILAICSLELGYPVSPRACNYDAFSVVKDQKEASFYVAGTVFEDMYADGVKESIDTGLHGWKIMISGTAADGMSFEEKVTSDQDGFWEYQPPVSLFAGDLLSGEVHLRICEALRDGWTQSYPAAGECRDLDLTSADPGTILDLDFGNWQPLEVAACYKHSNLNTSEALGDRPVSLTRDGVTIDTQLTEPNGCYTWTGLTPGVSYGVREESEDDGYPGHPEHWIFPRAKSGESLSYTFHSGIEGCTPGFWQGGNGVGTAGGKWLWNEDDDPDWLISGGSGWNPFSWTTLFNEFFASYEALDGMDMISLVDQGGGMEDYQKAARDLVAAYLNASWGMNYPYTLDQLSAMWADAVTSESFMDLHTALDTANNAYQNSGKGNCPIDAKNNGGQIYLFFLPVLVNSAD